MPRIDSEIQRISRRLVVPNLSVVENQVGTKHVETLLVPRLDEGSNPSSSTADSHTG